MTQRIDSKPSHNVRSGIRIGSMLAVCLLVSVALAARVLSEDSKPKDLRVFYGDHCARCHGFDGAARDAEGNPLRGEDLTDKRWREKTSDAEMVKTILKGKFFGWAMPGFKKLLTKEEAERMVTEVVRKAVPGKAIAPEEPPKVRE